MFCDEHGTIDCCPECLKDTWEAEAYHKGVSDSLRELQKVSKNNCYDVVADFVAEAEEAIASLYVNGPAS